MEFKKMPTYVVPLSAIFAYPVPYCLHVTISLMLCWIYNDLSLAFMQNYLKCISNLPSYTGSQLPTYVIL